MNNTFSTIPVLTEAHVGATVIYRDAVYGNKLTGVVKGVHTDLLRGEYAFVKTEGYNHDRLVYADEMTALGARGLLETEAAELAAEAANSAA